MPEATVALVRLADRTVALRGDAVLRVSEDGEFDATLEDLTEPSWAGESRVLRVRTAQGERGLRVPADALRLTAAEVQPVPRFLRPLARLGRWRGIVHTPADEGSPYALLMDLERLFAP